MTGGTITRPWTPCDTPLCVHTKGIAHECTTRTGEPAPSAGRESPSCRICGRDEGDDIGVVVGGTCSDCTRAWA
jgi:hypothetical protein